MNENTLWNLDVHPREHLLGGKLGETGEQEVNILSHKIIMTQNVAMERRALATLFTHREDCEPGWSPALEGRRGALSQPLLQGTLRK